jgi:hypothetical protein
MVSVRRQFVRVIDPDGGDKESCEASRLLDARKLERHSRRGLRFGDRLLVCEFRPVQRGTSGWSFHYKDPARLECVNSLEAGLLGPQALEQALASPAEGPYLVGLEGPTTSPMMASRPKTRQRTTDDTAVFGGRFSGEGITPRFDRGQEPSWCLLSGTAESSRRPSRRKANHAVSSKSAVIYLHAETLGWGWGVHSCRPR